MSTATKSEQMYIVNRADWTIIDLVDPETGLGYWGSAPRDYPSSSLIGEAEYDQGWAERHRGPIAWEPTTADRYYEMLCVLPPAWHGGTGFLVGEAFDHDMETGEARYSAYMIRGGEYVTSSRPLTVAEMVEQQVKL